MSHLKAKMRQIRLQLGLHPRSHLKMAQGVPPFQIFCGQRERKGKSYGDGMWADGIVYVLLLTVPQCSAICKSGGTCPPPVHYGVCASVHT